MKYYREPRIYYVYIMASKRNGTLYVGVTNDLARRAFEHKTHFNPDSFTARYNITRLVYAETFDDPTVAIAREKQLKSWSRNKKKDLIEKLNPNWDDLYAYTNVPRL